MKKEKEIDISSLNVHSPNGFMIHVKGDCMDSPKSPNRVRDKDCLLIHEIQCTEAEMTRQEGRLIALQMNNGVFVVKELIKYNDWFPYIEICCYNPNYQKIKVTCMAFSHFYAVDAVVSPEFVKSHTITNNLLK
ncbi:MAG: hypothetical protein LKG25_00790 [Prevotella sp.]|jgi:SOS-response transcriptional repressor LexA|nr:hypothetical protein [Prevotella sp.]MCI1281113.1 hypothetical protein [Prevotella sp.]